MAQYNEAGALLPSYGQEAQITDKVFYDEKVRRLVEASVAPETRRAYSAQLRRFLSWCESDGVNSPFPTSPELLASYIANLDDEGMSCSTVGQALAAISAVHKANGWTSPTESLLVKKTVKGYKREHGTAPQKKDAATVDVVHMLLDSIPQDSSAKHIRDRAIIALGFAGAFRRSELCALNMDDLKWTIRNDEEILLVEVRRSKTDQEGQGMTKAIFPSEDEDISPTALMKRWINRAGIQEGPIFRRILKNGRVTDERLTPQSVRLIIKDIAVDAGLSLNLSAHSLRSGFVTTAIRQGKTERSIMNQTGHRSTQVLREYFRREDAIEDNAARGVM